MSIDELHNKIDSKIGNVSLKQHKSRRRRGVWQVFIGFCISIILVVIVFFPAISDKTGIEHIQSLLKEQQPLSKTFTPIVQGNPYRYELIGNDTFSDTPGLHKYVNETFYRSWLNKTIVWHLEKSVDGKTWQDCSYLLKVKKDWDTENKTEKHTPNFIADETAYYRIGLRTFKDASLKDVNTKDLTSVNMSFDVSRDDKYVIWYNWSDYVKSSEFSKTSYSSKTVTDVSNKKEYRFDITTGIKLNSGEYFEIDPEFGSETEFESGAIRTCVITMLDENKIAIAYIDDADGDAGKAIVGTVSDKTITFGAISEFDNDVLLLDAGISRLGICKTNDSGLAVVFCDDGGGDDGKVRAATLSGTTIDAWSSIGYEWLWTDGNDAEFQSICQIDTDLQFCAGNNEGGSDDAWGGVMANSALGYSIKDRTEWSTNKPAYTDSCRLGALGSNKVIVSYLDTTAGTDGYAVVGQYWVANNTLLFGTPAEFSSNNNIYDTGVCALTDDTGVIIYTDRSLGSRVVHYTVTGREVTFGTPVTIPGTTSSLSAVSITNINSTQFFAVTINATGSTGMCVVGNVSGTTITLDNQSTFHAASTGGGSDFCLDVCNVTSWSEDCDNTSVCIVYQDDADGDKGKAMIVQIPNWGYSEEEPVAENETWQLIDDSFNGKITNTTNWYNIDDSFNGDITNTTNWYNIDDSINGDVTNTTNWYEISTLSGTVTNTTPLWQEITGTAYNGVVTNTTNWYTIDDTINGTITNVSGWVWTEIDCNINGRLINYTGNATGDTYVVMGAGDDMTMPVVFLCIGLILGMIIPVKIVKKRRKNKYEL